MRALVWPRRLATVLLSLAIIVPFALLVVLVVIAIRLWPGWPGLADSRLSLAGRRLLSRGADRIQALRVAREARRAVLEAASMRRLAENVVRRRIR